MPKVIRLKLSLEDADAVGMETITDNCFGWVTGLNEETLKRRVEEHYKLPKGMLDDYVIWPETVTIRAPIEEKEVA